MAKHFVISALMCGCVICANTVFDAWGAGDHFPAITGNYWLFSYRSLRGGWGSSVVDSGTVKWEIRSLIATKSYPAQVTALIEQTRTCIRRKVTPGIEDPPGLAGYDSIYSPPRITRDSLRLHWLEPGNAITRDSDTCIIMAHDPAQTLPSGKDVIRDTSVIYSGGLVYAKIIDPSPCRGGLPQCEEPDWFMTAAGIGPVAYFKQSPSCLMDAYWSERWSLVQTNAQTGVITPHGPRGLTVRGMPLAIKATGLRVFDPAGRRINRQGLTRHSVDLTPGIYLMEFRVDEIMPIVGR